MLERFGVYQNSEYFISTTLSKIMYQNKLVKYIFLIFINLVRFGLAVVYQKSNIQPFAYFRDCWKIWPTVYLNQKHLRHLLSLLFLVPWDSDSVWWHSKTWICRGLSRWFSCTLKFGTTVLGNNSVHRQFILAALIPACLLISFPLLSVVHWV